MKTRNDVPCPPEDASSLPETSPRPHGLNDQEGACAQPDGGDDVTPNESEALPHVPDPSDAAKREAKIATLKRAVESGTYDVSAEQLAEKLLQETLRDLLS